MSFLARPIKSKLTLFVNRLPIRKHHRYVNFRSNHVTCTSSVQNWTPLFTSSLPRIRDTNRSGRLTCRNFTSDAVGWPDNYILPPTKEELYRHGLPILSQAKAHADSNRILCYDNYCDRKAMDNCTPERTIIDCKGVTYREVLDRSSLIHDFIIDRYNSIQTRGSIGTSRDGTSIPRGTKSERIGFFCTPSSAYIATQWACWSTGSIAVPLCVSHKAPEFKHMVADSDPFIIVIQKSGGSNWEELDKALKELNMQDRIVFLEDIFANEGSGHRGLEETARLGQNGAIESMDSPSMIIYTSGTTGKPKGVLSTHRAVHHQVMDLVVKWKWVPDDCILHFLPLHHVHGVINKLCCAVWAGASLEFIKFDANHVWKRLGDSGKVPLTLFMAVPTIYAKLIEASRDLSPSYLERAVLASKSVRLMVSGSMALPTTVMKQWEQITGHVLLERYGMTEFAMALSNPFYPVKGRMPGFVGEPLPSVGVKLVHEETGETIPPGDDSGELCVKGPSVFKEYWQRLDATSEAFDSDGYFKTGDIAEYSTEVGSFRILGRASADIIKCGGYKLSALEIERVLLEHDDVEEIVVLGIEDDIWGERVAAICRMKRGASKILTLDALREWCDTRLSSYKVPSRLLLVNEIPKNAMGKVSKKKLVHLFLSKDHNEP